MAEKINDRDFEGTSLPFSNEAEQSVLGAILIDPPSINMILDKLRPEHFYIPQNRRIFEVLCSMSAASQTIDFITVLEKIKEDGLFDAAGGKTYLTTLAQCVPSSANITTYADIVRERYYVRSLIVSSRDIIEMASGGATDAGMLLDTAERKIYEIRQGKDISGLKLLRDVIEGETFVRLSKISDPETRKDYIGIPTGFSELDKTITGLNRSDLIIVGARPGMGKTAFALNIARNVAVQSSKTVCFFSLEMSRDQLAQRLLSSEAMIESGKLRTGDLTLDEWTRLTQASQNLAGADLYIDETSGITVPEIKAKLRRMKKVDLVIIDYLGLMQSAKRTENRVQEVSDITRNLKIMAKDLGVPVIVCAQLGRGTEVKGKSHKPALSDLRESGSIEQDADIVMFVYRENYYIQNEEPQQKASETPEHLQKRIEEWEARVRATANIGEVIIGKQRHGPTGTVQLFWNGDFAQFGNLAKEEYLPERIGD